jgi:hypothetical protein
MSSTRESGLWRWLKDAKQELRDELHMQRVENSIGGGTPDVEGHLFAFGQFWIELKSAARPKSDLPIRFKVRDAQVEWMRRRAKSGFHRAWLLLQVGSGKSARRYLVPGRHAGSVRDGVTEAWLQEKCSLLQWSGPGPHSAADVVRAAARELVGNTERR